ncbi:MAG: hypothetical protein AAB874_06940 [Patescibacteria group bacterium]
MSQSAHIHPLLIQLTEHKNKAKEAFATKHQQAHAWLKKRGLNIDELRMRSLKAMTGATLGSALVLASPQLGEVSKLPIVERRIDLSVFLNELFVLKKSPTSAEYEATIAMHIHKLYGISAVFELDQQRLPAYFGSMGLEQHLIRYEGDQLSDHDVFLNTGMAPARGAFGYFAEPGKTSAQMRVEEKYYIVLQTFLIPGWKSNWDSLKPWYKFRKFLVLNPDNGRAVVAVLGDSGPGQSTGKVFGGSPEVMAGLGIYPGKTKGDVLVLYLDDPGGKISLGEALLPKESEL